MIEIEKNIKAIRKEKGVTQEVIAEALGFDPANYSRIENGKQQLKVNQLEIIASALEVDITYLFTYPKKYVDIDSIQSQEKIAITFEVSPDKRDYLLKLVTGE